MSQFIAIGRFVDFIREREFIRVKREELKIPPPWTNDPILQRYRFCNVNRENDTVTRWVAANWRNPNQNHIYLPFAMCVARIFNRVQTLEAIGWPVPFDAKRVFKAANELRSKGLPIFGNAYLLSTHGKVIPKLQFAIDDLLKPAWRQRNKITYQITYQECEPLQAMFERLLKLKGFATFKAAQVIADLKYATPHLKAPDWFTFSASGPGSKRGMNRMLGLDAGAATTEELWKARLLELQFEVNAMTGKELQLHAQDLQNCLCEFDKYERCRLGQGRPKEIFKSGRDPELFA